MKHGRGKGAHRKPALRENMSVDDFSSYYWMKDSLVDFARRLGLPIGGDKPALTARIERRLRGLPDAPRTARNKAKGPRDSDHPLTRITQAHNYRSDSRTRAFFEEQIGPHFHFTYHLNQYRRAHENLTYGDLIDEWVAEYERRKSSSYKAPIAHHGEYNRHIRDFFADPANEGKTLRDAVASWNVIKRSRGDRSYAALSKKRSRIS
jgi:hypothetical protein